MYNMKLLHAAISEKCGCRRRKKSTRISHPPTFRRVTKNQALFKDFHAPNNMHRDHSTSMSIISDFNTAQENRECHKHDTLKKINKILPLKS